MLLLLAALITPSFAVDDYCAPFHTEDLSTTLAQAEAKLEGFELASVFHLLEQLRKDMACVDEAVPPESLGRFAQLKAVVAFFDQDASETRRWGLAARYIAPDLAWPEFVPPALVERMADLDDASLETVQGAVVHPKKAAVLLNGLPLSSPTWRVEVPGFVQVVDKKRRVDDAWWQDGVAFDDRIVASAGGPLPGWAVAWVPADAVAAADTVAVVDTDVEPETREELTVTDVAWAEAEIGEAGWIEQVDQTTFMPSCPWAGKTDLAPTAGGGWVKIAGEKYDVGGRKNRLAFLSVLESCHQFRAQRRFKQWRTMRTLTWISIIPYTAPVVVFTAGIVVVPFSLGGGVILLATGIGGELVGGIIGIPGTIAAGVSGPALKRGMLRAIVEDHAELGGVAGK